MGTGVLTTGTSSPATIAVTSTSTDLVIGALAGGLQRTAFFNGMFLTQSDMDVEQRFWRMKRRLTNRALGQGVVWGLRLLWDKVNDRFVLHPGYGLDCCGNDLVVSQLYEIRTGDLIDTSDPAVQALLANPDANGRSEVAVVLQYVECPEEPRPIHKDACGTSSTTCSPSRTRETTRLLLAAPMAAAITPIDAFWNSLQEFKDSLSANELAVVFPGESGSTAPASAAPPPPPPAAATPAPAGGASAAPAAPAPAKSSKRKPPASDASATPSELPFSLHVVHGDMAQEIPLDGSVALPALAVDPASPTTLVFELRSRMGWGFWRGAVRASGSDEPLTAVRSPVDPVLSWAWTAPAPGSSAFEMTVDDLGYAPLFSSERLSLPRLRINGQLVSGRTIRGETAPPGTTTGGTVGSTTDGPPTVVVVERAPTCFDPLRRLVFLDSDTPVGVYPSTLVLAAVYALLAEFAREDGTAASSSRTTLAAFFYAIVWKTLLGADLAASTPAQRVLLDKLFARLFAAWCAGLFYPGPRCTTQHHGIYLGQLVLGRAGGIQSFDPWARRYVLTGPLLTHWAGLFGIAPFDVIVGRLARVICCIARIDLGKLSFEQLGIKPLADVREIRSVPMLGDFGPVMFATPAAAKTALDARGLTLQGTDQVSPATFVFRLLRVLTQSGSGNPTAVRLVTLNGQAGEQLQILEPVAAPAVPAPAAAAHEAVAVAVEKRQVAKLAAAPLTDFGTELALGTPVPIVNNNALSAALTQQNVTSVASLLALDPEAVAGFVAAAQRNDAWYTAVNDVFAASQRVLDEMVDRIVRASTQGRPLFLRQNLTDDKFVADVAQLLSRDKSVVAAAAARAQAANPTA
jgi:hypothetical protein